MAGDVALAVADIAGFVVGIEGDELPQQQQVADEQWVGVVERCGGDDGGGGDRTGIGDVPGRGGGPAGDHKAQDDAAGLLDVTQHVGLVERERAVDHPCGVRAREPVSNLYL